MMGPQLTFACELESTKLQSIFNRNTLATLDTLKASVSLAILDFSPERAEAVRKLNLAGIPVIAWMLLPKEQGYWFNLDNADQATERTMQFLAWSKEEGLKWSGIGLDIEPDLRLFLELQGKSGSRSKTIFKLIGRAFSWRKFNRARKIYRALIRQIHAEGYTVESYQLPIILDDRQARSTLIQRTTGIVDLGVDREMIMLYTSFFRPNGPGMLWSYAPDAQAIGVGITSRGMEQEFMESTPLNWEEFSRDLRLAWCFTPNIFIYSLEGCLAQDFLDKLKTFEWDQPIFEPREMATKVDQLRNSVRPALWVSAHLWWLLLGAGILLAIFLPIRRRMKRKRNRLESGMRD